MGGEAITDLIRTIIYVKYSGSMKITARLDYVILLVIVKQHLVQTGRID